MLSQSTEANCESIETRRATRVLAFYRGKLLEQRGTPIRVRSILGEVENDERIDLSIATWDASVSSFKKHFCLSNNHLQDVLKLYRFIKSERIDVVIGYTSSASYYLTALKFLTNTKTIIEIHGVTEEEARAYGDISFAKYWTYKAWSVLTYKVCDLVITCSTGVSMMVEKHCNKTISLIGGVDPSEFNPKVQGGKYFNHDERIVIGYAGNARVWQGLGFLMATFRELVKDHANFRLILLLSDRKGVEKCGDIELYGPLPHEEVPKFLIDCDILVIPRPDTVVTRISFASKIPEYLAMGKAIVAANVGDANQVIENDVNGLLYTPENEKELIGALLRLQDSSLRKRLGSAASESAGKLSWKNLGERLVDNILNLS